MTDDIERQREHFNSISERYLDGREHPNHQHIKALIWNLALEGIDWPTESPIRVLEPMCGFAEGKKILESHSMVPIEYAGFDYSDSVIDSLRAQSPELNVWQADATSYQPDPGAYDVVLLIGGLHHVPNDAKEIVRSLASGLTADGLFINLEPTFGNPITNFVRRKIYENNDIFDEVTERDFHISELEDMFVSAGLNNVSTLYPGLLAYVLYYNTYAFPFLNKGGKKVVQLFFGVDRLFVRNVIGRIFSFATLSIWKKPHP